MFILLLTACSVRLPAPTLTSVSPERGWNGEETVITITGTGFYPQVEIDTNRNGGVDLDRSYQAWLQGDGLGRHTLSAVSIDDYEQLRAVVRSGLGAGTYDLLIEGPTGEVASLEDAYLVSNTRADRLTVTLEPVDRVPTVNDQVIVAIQLLDPAELPVLEDLEVVVRAEGIDQPVLGVFGGGLIDAEPLPDVLGLRGFIGSDGAARIPLTIETPGTIRVTVEAAVPSTGVRSGQALQLWQAGDELITVFELPQPGFEVDAGDTFPMTVRLRDQFGNDVTGVSAELLVQTSCEDFNAARVVSSGDAINVRPRRSTEFGNCPEQRLRVLQGPQGVSEPFVVRSGPPQTFSVQQVFDPVRAGEDVVGLISARDANDNRTVFPLQFELRDSVGGLGPVVCGASSNGVDRNCRAPSFVAGPAVTLTASTSTISGTSLPYQVLPDLTVQRILVTASGPATAGEELEVLLGFFDPYDNAIPAGEVDLSALELDNGAGVRVACEPGGITAGGEAQFTCIFEQARIDARIGAHLGSIDGLSGPFVIQNAPLANVEIDGPHDVVAGEAFELSVVATDAFGNPYLNQLPDVLNLDHPTLGSVPVPLQPDGTATVGLTLTQAGASAVLPTDAASDPLGLPHSLTVAAAAPASLDVQLPHPWVFVGEVNTFEVRAFDAFGNLAVETTPVVLASQLGGAPSQIATWDQGVASTNLVWNTAGLDDRVLATAGALQGSSERLDVAQDCGVMGPSVVADFGGAPVGRACVVPGQRSAVAMSLTGSTPGTSPLAYYVARIPGQDPVRSTSPAFNVQVEDVGRNDVEVVVLDAAACGTEAEVRIWAGPDDGQPVGMLVTQLSAASAPLEDAIGIQVLGAVDCTGDPSTGTLQVRTDRGSLSGVFPTGAGLRTQLDASGTATFSVSTTGVPTGGPTRVEIRSPSGGAADTIDVEFLGDNGLPTVWSQSPNGATSGLISTIVLEFDEPLLPVTVTPANFAVTGLAAVPIDTVTQTLPGRVEIELGIPADADNEVFTVLASRELRDEAGNRLDGDVSGGPADWIGVFGQVVDALDPVSCELDTNRFRPDGDDGSGPEADQVQVEIHSSTTPAWWRLRVDDDEGARIFQERFVPAGSSDILVWDGRDSRSRIVEDGSYTLRAAAEDAFGNRTPPCVRTVSVDNAAVLP